MSTKQAAAWQTSVRMTRTRAGELENFVLSLVPTSDSHSNRGREFRPFVVPRAPAVAWLLLVCVAIASSLGCTPVRQYFRNGFKVGPNFQRPTAPVAEKWIDSEDKRVHSVPEDIRAGGPYLTIR